MRHIHIKHLPTFPNSVTSDSFVSLRTSIQRLSVHPLPHGEKSELVNRLEFWDSFAFLWSLLIMMMMFWWMMTDFPAPFPTSWPSPLRIPSINMWKGHNTPWATFKQFLFPYRQSKENPMLSTLLSSKTSSHFMSLVSRLQDTGFC